MNHKPLIISLRRSLSRLFPSKALIITLPGGSARGRAFRSATAAPATLLKPVWGFRGGKPLTPFARRGKQFDWSGFAGTAKVDRKQFWRAVPSFPSYTEMKGGRCCLNCAVPAAQRTSNWTGHRLFCDHPYHKVECFFEPSLSSFYFLFSREKKPQHVCL